MYAYTYLCITILDAQLLICDTDVFADVYTCIAKHTSTPTQPTVGTGPCGLCSWLDCSCWVAQLRFISLLGFAAYSAEMGSRFGH